MKEDEEQGQYQGLLTEREGHRIDQARQPTTNWVQLICAIAIALVSGVFIGQAKIPRSTEYGLPSKYIPPLLI